MRQVQTWCRHAPNTNDTAELTIAAIATKYTGQRISIRARNALISADEDGQGSMS
jgi:hypothetical protein